MEISSEALAIIRLASRLLANAAADPILRALAERVVAHSRVAAAASSGADRPSAVEESTGFPVSGAAAAAASPRQSSASAAAGQTVVVPAELLCELLEELGTAAQRLGQVQPSQVQVSSAALREILDAARAAGAKPDLIAQAERALQTTRETRSGSMAEIPSDLLKALTDAISREAARLLAQETATGRPAEAPQELTAFLRDALGAALQLIGADSAGTQQAGPNMRMGASPAILLPASTLEALIERAELRPGGADEAVRVIRQALEAAQSEGGADQQVQVPAAAFRALLASLASSSQTTAAAGEGRPQTVVVSADLLAAVLEGVRAAGGNPSLIARAESLLSQPGGRGAMVEVDSDMLRALFAEIENAGARIMDESPDARVLRLPVGLYHGAIAALALAAEARPSHGAESAPPASVALAPDSVSEAVRAIQDLLRQLAPRVVGDESFGRDVARVESALRLLAQDQPVLTRQIALSLEAFVRIEPGSLALGLSRAATVLSRILSPISREASAAPTALQAILQAQPGDSSALRGPLSQLRSLGAQVQIQPSDNQPNATLILLTLGQTDESQAPPLRLDLRSELPQGIESALRGLLAELEPAMRSDGSLRPIVQAFEEALRAVDQNRPLLARQVALALSAFVRLEPDNIGLGLARATGLLSQVSSPNQAERAAAPISLQVLLQAPPRDVAAVQGLMDQLRSLGAQVRVQPSEGSGQQLIVLNLGQTGGGESQPMTLDLRLGTLVEEAQSAIRRLLDSLGPAARLNGGLRAEADSLETLLRSMAQNRPLLTQQLAMALQAFSQTGPQDLRGALSRAGVLLAQIFSLARPLPASGAGSPPPTQQAGPSALIQVFMETNAEHLEGIRDLLGQLRALGAKVDIQQSAHRQGFSEILLTLGEPAAMKEPRPFLLDLRLGSSPPVPVQGSDVQTPAESRTPAQGAERPNERPAGERQFAEERGFQPVGRVAPEGRPSEVFRPNPIPVHSLEPPPPDFNPWAPGFPPPLPAPELPPGLIEELPAEEKRELLRLTYEPELTRAWQLAHFQEMGSADSILGPKKGILIQTRIEAGGDERP